MAQIPKIEIEVGVRNTCVCTEIPSGTYPEVTFETVYCSYHAQKIDAIKATLREQIAREIGEMQINFPDPNSLSGVKELTGTEVKFKAIAIARGSEG